MSTPADIQGSQALQPLHFPLWGSRLIEAGLEALRQLGANGCLLVGVDYGQTLEGTHPSGGHLALGKVMRTPEIDFVAGPPSYEGRESGGSAAFAAPVDSFPLNGKPGVRQVEGDCP